MTKFWRGDQILVLSNVLSDQNLSAQKFWPTKSFVRRNIETNRIFIFSEICCSYMSIVIILLVYTTHLHGDSAVLLHLPLLSTHHIQAGRFLFFDHGFQITSESLWLVLSTFLGFKLDPF